MTENNGPDKPELRKISNEELMQILEEHKKWINSKQQEGKCADLSNTDLCRVNLSKADLSDANLQNANLQSANLEDALVMNTDFRKANLNRADFQKSALIGANLENASLKFTNFENAFMAAVKYKRGRGKYRGIRVATCYGSDRFKRFAQDQAYIDEFAGGKWWEKCLYWMWLIFADCGRTPWYWIGWSIFIAVFFGFKLFSLGPESFNLDHLEWNLSSMIYYSVVTFTTLGFGDIKPLTNTAAWWVMAEVVLGYIMLGGLISILATIIARRS